MKILVAGVGEQGYGNFHTITRICKAIEAVDSSIKCQSYQISGGSDCINQIKSLEPDVILGIHLRRCSQFAELPPEVPYLLICGGTDINEEIENEISLKVMKRNLLRARGLIVFSSSMERQLMKSFAAELEISRLNVWKIPQTVVTCAPVAERIEDVYNLINLNVGTPYFLVVGRIRKVKDPCFIMQPFHEWASRRDDNAHRLVFLGGLDTKEGEQSDNFLRELDRYAAFIDHVHNLSTEQCQDVVRHATAVINCSHSEGQALSILEAIAVGTPVIVRDIPGNLDIVDHLKTGLVFSDSKTFQTCLSHIVDDSGVREILISRAKMFVEEQHGDIMVEGKRYIEAIRSSLKTD